MKEVWKKIRPIIQWILVAFFVLFLIGNWPHPTVICYIIAAILFLPIPKYEEILAKFKINFVVKLIIALVLIIIAAIKTGDERALAEIKARQENKTTTSSENKNDSKTDETDEVKAQILDTWHYGDSVAIDRSYTFFEDGTWTMSSQGGTTDEGTYEIFDGKTIKCKGQYYNPRFRIKSKDKLIDDDGVELKRFVPDYYDDDDDD